MMTNPYTPPTEPDQRRGSWSVFPFWELLTIAVFVWAAYLFVFVGTEEAALCLAGSVLLAIVAIGRRSA